MCCEAVKEATELCTKFKDFLSDVPSKLNDLRELQTEYDRQLSDLLHEIELSETYDTRRGMIDAQVLRKILKARREVKDEFFMLNAVDKQVCKGTILRDLENVTRIAPSQDERKYGKRVS